MRDGPGNGGSSGVGSIPGPVWRVAGRDLMSNACVHRMSPPVFNNR